MTAHRDLVDAEFALNGDGGGGVLSEGTAQPLIYYVQGAEKSSAQYLLTTHNPGGHSSQPRPDNAIYELADALKAVQRYEFPVMWNEWTLGDFNAASHVTQGALGAAMACYDTALQYAKTRKQFANKPIASHQLVQEKLAWMITEIVKGQLLALHVGRVVAKDAAEGGI